MTEIETALLRDRKAKVQQYFAMWVTRDFEALPKYLRSIVIIKNAMDQHIYH